jgi:hypothetical protein
MTRVANVGLALAVLTLPACDGAISASGPARPESAPSPPPAAEPAAQASARHRELMLARKRAAEPPAGMAVDGMASAAGGASGPEPAQPEVRFTAEQVLSYARYLAPALIGRVLSDAEQRALEAEPMTALALMLDEWGQEEGFAESARTMMEVRLAASGQRDGVDHGLPGYLGYLVAHVVKHDRPWSEVLTSDTCYDAADQPIACDTGAPYTAGVLTTRGFLAANEGRFNLRRSITTMATFACRD